MIGETLEMASRERLSNEEGMEENMGKIRERLRVGKRG